MVVRRRNHKGTVWSGESTQPVNKLALAGISWVQPVSTPNYFDKGKEWITSEIVQLFDLISHSNKGYQTLIEIVKEVLTANYHYAGYAARLIADNYYFIARKPSVEPKLLSTLKHIATILHKHKVPERFPDDFRYLTKAIENEGIRKF